jgi:hypothetical protein
MAGQYDFILEQGATFSRVVTWKDSTNALVNLTGYTAKMQIRDASGGVIVSLTDTNGGITLGGAAGTITITISATQTTAFTFNTARYDLDIVSGTTVKRLLKGQVTLDPEVTP